MIRGLYTSASGMTTQIKKQDTVANNIANVNTNGFKKALTIMEQGKEMEIYKKEDAVDDFVPTIEPKAKLKKIGKLGTGVKVAENHTSYEQGIFKETEEKLDFALEGKGFFAFHTANGIRYSRNGSMSLDRDGYVVNGNGDKLLAHNFQGELAYVKIEGDLIINSNGDIAGAILDVANENLEGLNDLVLNFSNLNQVNDKVLIREFDDLRDLKVEGDSYFYFENEDEVLVSNGNKVHQGFLEGSNVNIVKEMVEMINVSRLYETNQKVLSSQEESVKNSNDIAKWT